MTRAVDCIALFDVRLAVAAARAAAAAGSRAGCCRAARDAGAALRVPFGARLDAIAAAGGGHALRGRGAGLLAWLAWVALCVAAARPQQLGDAVAPPQVGRDLMLARRPVRQHERRGHGARRRRRRSPHRGEGRARRLPRSPRRRSRRPARVRPARVCAHAADARPGHRAPATRRQRGRPGRARDRDRRRHRRSRSSACSRSPPTQRVADPAHRRREHRGRARSAQGRRTRARREACACTPIAFGGEGGHVAVRLPPAAARRRRRDRRSRRCKRIADTSPAAASSARATPNRSPASTPRSIGSNRSSARARRVRPRIERYPLAARRSRWRARLLRAVRRVPSRRRA